MLAWFESLFSGCFASLIAWALLACSSCLPACLPGYFFFFSLCMLSQPLHDTHSCLPGLLPACLATHGFFFLLASCLLSHVIAWLLVYYFILSALLLLMHAQPATWYSATPGCLPRTPPPACLRPPRSKKQPRKAWRKQEERSSFDCSWLTWLLPFLASCLLACLASHHVILPQ